MASRWSAVGEARIDGEHTPNQSPRSRSVALEGIGGIVSVTYTPETATELLHCSADHVRALCASGRLAAVNVGLGKRRARWVITQQAIEAFLTPQPAASSKRVQPKTKPRKWI